MKRVLASSVIFLSFFSFSIAATEISIRQAADAKISNIQVRGEGQVIRLFPDDNQGARHQKFILLLAHHQTILVSHNIDLAPKIENLQRGDTVAFYGEYQWNNKGGVVHWTHKDAKGTHLDGWLQYQGKKYD